MRGLICSRSQIRLGVSSLCISVQNSTECVEFILNWFNWITKWGGGGGGGGGKKL